MRDADAVGFHISAPHDDADALAVLSSLTPAERRVLRQLAVARTSRAVSEALYISVRTVEKHRGNIVRKLGLRGSNALLSFAVTHADLIEKMDVGGGGKKIPG
jgi:DNA-binding CsgD family transcriptional regulator